MQVLITGANRGIGTALASAYLKAGHNVIGTARNISGLSPDIEWVEFDVSIPSSALTSALAGRPLDLLICNAGVFPGKGLQGIENYTAEIFADTLAVNVTGVFLTIQASLRLSKGRIAIISSDMASSSLAEGGSYAYCASKAAVTNLACNLAVDLRKDGIAVGSYHPGWVRTDMGSDEADISVEDSVSGLMKRFNALSLKTTGVYESYEGEQMAF